MDFVSEDELLTAEEVATLFGVDPKTVTRWADSGKLSFMRTPGRHRRYSELEVTRLLARSEEPGPPTTGH